MIIIDPATRWFEIVETHTKTAEHISKLLDRTWFSHYPRPQFYIFDNGNEFLGEKFKEMIESYYLIGIPTKVKNPHANLVECVNQALNSMTHLHNIENRILDNKEPFIDILCACA